MLLEQVAVAAERGQSVEQGSMPMTTTRSKQRDQTVLLVEEPARVPPELPVLRQTDPELPNCYCYCYYCC